MKNLKYILFATIIIFIGTGNVSAKEIAKHCQYNYKDELSGQSSNLELIIYTDKTADAIRLSNGEKYNLTIKNIELIQNNIDNVTCPNYSVVRMRSFAMFANDRETIINYLTENGLLDEKSHIASSSEYNASSPESEQYYKEMLTESENILKVTEDFSIDECLNEDKVITAYQKCNEAYDGYKRRINLFNSRLNNYITQNYISANDSRVATMRENIKNAEDNLIKIKYEIDNKVEIVDPNYKYGCDIFGDTIISVINQIYNYFKWIIPVLIIVLSMTDFVKVVGTGKDDDFKKAQNNLLKRIVLGVIFFIIPTIISLIIEFSGITEQFTNGDSIIEAVTCILK